MRDDIVVISPDDYMKTSQIDEHAALGQSEEFFRLRVITPESIPDSALGGALFVLPAGQRTNPHIHSSDTHAVIYVIQGQGRSFMGDNAEHEHDVAAGDFIYVPPAVRHYTINTGDEAIIAVVVRTAPTNADTELKHADED